MYIDCKNCGYESEAFLIIGENPWEIVREIVEKAGGKVDIVDDGIEIKCSCGNKADILPTEFKFRKRWEWSKCKMSGEDQEQKL